MPSHSLLYQLAISCRSCYMNGHWAGPCLTNYFSTHGIIHLSLNGTRCRTIREQMPLLALRLALAVERQQQWAANERVAAVLVRLW